MTLKVRNKSLRATEMTARDTRNRTIRLTFDFVNSLMDAEKELKCCLNALNRSSLKMAILDL